MPEPTELFYAADFANVLEQSTIDDIVTRNDSLYAQTGAQLVVVTVDFLGSAAIDDYAYTLFNDWGIGDKDKNNGLLLLLAIGDDNHYALQGKGLEQELTAGELDDLLYEYLEPDFADKDYDAGVRKTFDALYSELESIYGAVEGGVTQPDGQQDAQPAQTRRPSTATVMGGFFSSAARAAGGFACFAIVVIAVVLGAILPRRRRFHGGMPPPPPPPFGGFHHHHHRPPRPPFGGGWGGGGWPPGRVLRRRFPGRILPQRRGRGRFPEGRRFPQRRGRFLPGRRRGPPALAPIIAKQPAVPQGTARPFPKAIVYEGGTAK